MTSTYKERTGHFMAHWGVPDEIYPRKPIAGLNLAILEFSPKPDAPYWRYATNGMSEHLQPVDDEGEGVRTELIAYSQNRQEWVINLLDALCRYPGQQSTYFCEYDTVSVGQPIDRGASVFDAALFAPPPSTEAPTLSEMHELFPEPVDVLCVIGVYDSECDEEGETIFDSLEPKGVALIDVSRSPVEP